VDLWTYCGLAELDELDALVRDGEGLRASERMALAYHEPGKLAGERVALRKRIGAEMPAEDAMRMAREELAKLRAER